MLFGYINYYLRWYKDMFGLYLQSRSLFAKIVRSGRYSKSKVHSAPFLSYFDMRMSYFAMCPSSRAAARPTRLYHSGTKARLRRWRLCISP